MATVLMLLLAAAVAERAGAAIPPTVPSFAAPEAAAVRAAVEAYRTAWLRNDPDAVMAAFTTDPVIMPHHGVAPRAGAAAVRDFWWPKGGPAAGVTRFAVTVAEVGGENTLAFARGTYELEFWHDEAGQRHAAATAGTFLMLLRRQQDGSWRISHHMWGDPPARR